MATINIILQAKGGVGKSTCANLLAQYFLECGHKVCCYDTDPANPSLSRYKALDVVRESLMQGDQVISGAFEDWLERLMNHGKEDFVVIDCGSSNFRAMLLELEAVSFTELCREHDHELFIHTVVMDGPEIVTQLVGIEELISTFRGSNFVVWKNEHREPINLGGHAMEETKYFAKHRNILRRVITVPQQTRNTRISFLNDMYKKHLTFGEAIRSKDFSIVARSHLRQYWKEVQDEIASGLGDMPTDLRKDQSHESAA